MNEIYHYLSNVVSQNALYFTDIHIEEGYYIRFRLPSGWTVTEDSRAFGEVTDEVLASFLDRLDSQWDTKLRQGIPLSVTIDLSRILRDDKVRPFRFRCFAYTVGSGLRAMVSMRPIGDTPMSLSQTGLPPVVRTFVQAPRGLLLVTGHTGAGKTTTIMALLSEILSQRAVHVVTIEDPIEYRILSGKGIISQREVGRDVGSYSSGLIDAMRQRPDVIMVGEIRDVETAETCLQAAESGHFVVGTMHARSCVGAMQKIIALADVTPASLSGAVVGVVGQTLVPRIDGRGEVLAAEVFVNISSETQRLVADGNWANIEAMLNSGKNGCTALNTSLASLVAKEVVSRDAAASHAYDPWALRAKLDGR